MIKQNVHICLVFSLWACSAQKHPMENDTSTTEVCTPVEYEPEPFVDAVVSFSPGDGAGFGQESFPDIVFGPPEGAGDMRGSFDVLSLGNGGEIVLAFADWIIYDAEGVDFIVFENTFIGWIEIGEVSVSMDGVEWYTFPCSLEEPYTNCAGVTPVFSNIDNCIDARNIEEAGGDGFDLALLGIESAKYVKIVDKSILGFGGFDLDGIAIVHGIAE